MNCALTTVSGFIKEIGLCLAIQKTKAVLFTTRKKYRKPSFELCGMKEAVSQHIKYLSIWFDGKLSFRGHLRQQRRKQIEL